MKVELTGNPVYPNFDVYYAGASMPAPILCCDTETFWIWRIVDGRVSCQYVVQSSFEEARANPDVERV